MLTFAEESAALALIFRLEISYPTLALYDVVEDEKEGDIFALETLREARFAFVESGAAMLLEYVEPPTPTSLLLTDILILDELTENFVPVDPLTENFNVQTVFVPLNGEV